MSQIYKSVSSTPAVPTVFTEDVGSATPAANNLNIFGGSGISTSGSGDTVTISLSNSGEATGQTVGAVTDNITCVNVGAIAATFSFTMHIAGFVDAGANPGDGLGVFISGVVRTDGATATLIGSGNVYTFEDTSVSGASVALSVSGNSLICDVTGVAGETINWAILTYGVFAET